MKKLTKIRYQVQIMTKNDSVNQYLIYKQLFKLFLMISLEKISS